MSDLPLEQARDALVAGGITGPHRSHHRKGSIDKIQDLLDGDAAATFGLSGLDSYPAARVLACMAELTGCSPDIEDLILEDHIDPDSTVRGILDAATRLRDAARRGDALLAGTGHPTGLLEHYIRVVDAYVAAGGKVLRPREGDNLPIGKKGRPEHVLYVGGVACRSDWGNLKHTHEPDAMEALLEARPWPDIVLGDHGFAGAAIERAIPTVAIMDINDHAIAVARVERRDVTVVPMDDNRPPRLYEPSWRLFEAVILGTGGDGRNMPSEQAR